MHAVLLQYASLHQSKWYAYSHYLSLHSSELVLSLLCRHDSFARTFVTSSDVMQVVSYMLGLPINLNHEQPLPDSDSDEEELTGRVNRLWRPSLRPMVKSYSHASM